MESSTSNSNSNDLYWIIDHEDLCWAPGKNLKFLIITIGKFFKDNGDEVHVQCLDDG